MVAGAPGVWEVKGLVDNDGFLRLQPGIRARFYPDNLSSSVLDCIIESINSYADRSVDWPLLIDMHGGQLETIANVETPQQRIIQTPRHSVTASLGSSYQGEIQLRGVLIVHRWSSALFTSLWKRINNIVQRELDF
jgi:putative peptide zinc metalloprotease protein